MSSEYYDWDSIQVSYKVSPDANGWRTTYIHRNIFLELIESSCSIAAVRLRKELQQNNMTNDEREQKFAEFFIGAYNKGSDVATMTYEELDSWIDQLEDIILEAKAQHQGADRAKRERKAKLARSEREKLAGDSDSTLNVSDSIAAVKKRKDRMSKRDKLEEEYRAMGISEEDIKQLLGKISVNEDTQPAKNNLVTFNKGKEKEEVSSETKPLAVQCEKCKEFYVAAMGHKCKPAAIPMPDFNDLFK